MAPQLRKAVFALGTVALAACTSPTWSPQPEGVRLTVARDAYVSGDTLSASLENGSGVQIGFNLCFSSLQRREGSGWTVTDELLVLCPAAVRTLGSGESATYRRPLSAGLLAGTYRLRTDVAVPVDGHFVELHSDTFSIGR